MYADETGDLDMSGSPGASTYFGFGTATFVGQHGAEIWDGFELRARLTQRGLHLPKGLHAVYDTPATRNEVFGVIAQQNVRFDTTFLRKGNAYQSIKNAGQLYLYKLAWFLHFKYVVEQVTAPGDTQTGSARAALQDVCGQFSYNRTIVLCVWDAATSWGVQVADYGLWATQRVVEGRSCPWFDPVVKPRLASKFAPWGWT